VKVEIKVAKVEGVCEAGYKVGDRIYLDKFLLSSDKPICVHAISSLSNVAYALSHGMEPESLGVKEIYLSCPDPGTELGRGRVIFKLEVVD